MLPKTTPIQLHLHQNNRQKIESNFPGHRHFAGRACYSLWLSGLHFRQFER